ncbi:hypothetical protein UG55_10174 [Frankia sp. EI5c]|uniref:hypothetical protein n=1 Tax=Frankia sp. EI5c TaxID=683316 RepID=UPI0007C2796A|nr:hypothetical protein [Frankia sp. EI5c]OAA26162.1 hypothetical protein UG55_10174 [Frankia sp. EI5c]
MADITSRPLLLPHPQAGVAVVAAGSVVFAGPIRNSLDDSEPAPAAIVAMQPAASSDLANWGRRVARVHDYDHRPHVTAARPGGG